MKKVVFICLLTLSLCLGKPAEPVPGAPVSPDQGKVNPPGAVPEKPADPEHNASAPNAQKVTEATSASDQKPTVPVTVPTIKPDDQTNKAPSTPVVPTKDTPTPAPTGGKANKTEPTTKEGTTTTTPIPKISTVPSSTVASTPKPTESSDVPLQARGFDGASFIGGIILTLGLLAIGFMGFKYYKNQTERNYHTL